MSHLLLFDIDGTLLLFKKGESARIFSLMIEGLFGRTAKVKKTLDFSGKTDLQILKEISADYGVSYSDIEKNISAVWRKLADFFRPYCIADNIEVLPGVAELLQKLDDDENFQLGLLTGNFKENAYQKLGAYGLDRLFPFGAFGSDDADRNKLPSTAFVRANEYVGSECFSNANSLIIGDSKRDIECGKVNGIPVVCVATGWDAEEELLEMEPDVFMEDFSDVEGTIDIIKGLFQL